MRFGMGAEMHRNYMISLMLSILAIALPMGADESVKLPQIACVENATRPLYGVRTIALDRELWRTDTDEEPFFRGIDKVLMDPAADEYFVLDERSRTIHVYAADGVRLRSLHLEGEGPGKVEALVDIQLLPGGQLGLLCPIGPTIVRITRQGEPLYNYLSRIDFFSDTGSITCCYSFAPFGDMFVLAGEQSFQGHSFLSVFTDYGDYRRILLDRPIHFRPRDRVFDDHDDFLLAYRPWVVASNQLVYFSPQRNGDGRYLLHAVDGEGRLRLKTSREFASRRRSAHELETVKAAHYSGREAIDSLAARGWSIIMPERDPDVLSIAEQSNGLWVETSRTRDIPGRWIYDVFALDGRFVEQATVSCRDGDNQRDALYVFDDTVVVVKGQLDALTMGLHADQDELQLICYARRDSMLVLQ